MSDVAIRGWNVNDCLRTSVVSTDPFIYVRRHNFKTPLLPASKHSQLKGGTSSRDAPAMLIITGSEHNLEISYRVVFGYQYYTGVNTNLRLGKRQGGVGDSRAADPEQAGKGRFRAI